MTGDTYFHMPGVASVRWDAPNNAVLVEWEGWANTAEFQALLDSEIKALKDHGGPSKKHGTGWQARAASARARAGA